MSIINDALKKTQAKLNKTSNKPEDPKTETTPQEEPDNITNVYEKLYQSRKEKQKNANPTDVATPTKETTQPLRRAKTFFKNTIILLLSLAGIIGSYYYLTHNETVHQFFPSITKFKINTKPRQTSAPTSAKKRIYKSNDLVLNGTSLIDEKYAALINDEIYEVGDIINGKKITLIDLNKVELQDNDTIITLKTH